MENDSFWCCCVWSTTATFWIHSILLANDYQWNQKFLNFMQTIWHGFHCGQLGFQVSFFHIFPSNWHSSHLMSSFCSSCANASETWYGDLQDIPPHLFFFWKSAARCGKSPTFLCTANKQYQMDHVTSVAYDTCSVFAISKRFKIQNPMSQDFNSVYHITVMQCLHSQTCLHGIATSCH